VVGKGWTAAGELEIGDELVGVEGQRMAVEEMEETEEYVTLYNLWVAEHHTYFVGADEWGFSVWAHNEYTNLKALFVSLGMFGDEPGQFSKKTLETAMTILKRDGDQAFHDYIMDKMGKNADAFIAETAWDAALRTHHLHASQIHTRYGISEEGRSRCCRSSLQGC
jgi:Pretoxin HINT domain